MSAMSVRERRDTERVELRTESSAEEICTSAVTGSSLMIGGGSESPLSRDQKMKAQMFGFLTLSCEKNN